MDLTRRGGEEERIRGGEEELIEQLVMLCTLAIGHNWTVIVR